MMLERLNSLFTSSTTSFSTFRTHNQLVPLDKEDSCYTYVENLFMSGWKHPRSRKSRPEVCGIFEVLVPDALLQSYIQYREQVENRLAKKHKVNGNERLLFHGTTKLCSLGESRKSTRACHLNGCSLCSIIRNSYDVGLCGTKHGFTRFGRGIYTTSCSSKADDYNSGPPNKAIRALLVNRVVVGKSLKLYDNATRLQVPRGYDSVTGKPGRDLNYPETVVYHNDAIRPAYVILFKDAPIKPIVHPPNILSKLFKTPLAE